MNTATISIEQEGRRWKAHYSPSRFSWFMTVRDERGAPRLYRDSRDARIAAYEALIEEENRSYCLHLDPGQISLPAKPKSFAGKRALAQSVFRERAEA